MLWKELEFTTNSGLQPQYQAKFFEGLTEESANNFVFTRQLTMNFSVDPAVMAHLDKRASITSTIRTLTTIFKYAAPFLQILNLEIEPFIRLGGGANDTPSPALDTCNSAMYHCLEKIARQELDYTTFVVEVGGLSPTSDLKCQHLLRLLAPKVTNLVITDSPYFWNDWFPLTRRLRFLQTRNVSRSNGADDGIYRWKTISALPLSTLLVPGIKIPTDIQHYLPRTLTCLDLSETDDIAVAVVCFTKLPQLIMFGLNRAKQKNAAMDRSTVIKDTVCTELRCVHFLDSLVPPGLLSVIATRNPRLSHVSAPPNISVKDITNLRTYCLRLETLTMSESPLGAPKT